MIPLLIRILTWLGYIFALIGFFATIYKAIQAWLSLKTYTWKDVDNGTKKLLIKIKNDNYFPDIIVTIGRGGAIVGSIISGNLHSTNNLKSKTKCNIPILGCDRIYDWKDGQRKEIPNKMIDLSPLKNKDVLLVAGDILTGGTMSCFLKQVEQVAPKCIRTACLVKGITSTLEPCYFAREIPGDFKMPWMFKGYGYIRDSRHPNQ